MTGKLEVLHGRYAKRLLPPAQKLCRAAPELDPDDLVQEAFVRFLDHFEEPITKQNDEYVMNWLINVMNRHFYDQLRKRSSRQKAVDDPTLTRWTQAQDVPPSTYERIGQERFDWAINQLPKQQRITYLLRCQNLTNPEIASKLGVPVATVNKRLFDARVSLRKLLQPYVDEGIQ
ncbi:RNA polymerase sigma factor [Cystobacter ferrugineus]|uniref:RNA polymerase sigma factor n=1 Tax=Cystobacter ferrugineus TaxID=83449 RepID=UPI001FE7C24F|nr:RNA polymerase sigma factor [Cystobacter ferrugineus]